MTAKETRIVYLRHLPNGKWEFGWHPVPSAVMWDGKSWESQQEAQIQAELRFERDAVIFEKEAGLAQEPLGSGSRKIVEHN
jgi:hypothetical protein